MIIYGVEKQKDTRWEKKDASAVADYLSGKDVKDIETYDLADWDEDLVKYENYQTILPPSVVKELIDGNTVDEVGEVNNLKVIEFSWGSEEESGYLDGHVPTAVHIMDSRLFFCTLFMEMLLKYLLQ